MVHDDETPLRLPGADWLMGRSASGAPPDRHDERHDPMSKARPTIRKHVPDITDATRPKADRPETPSQAATWETVKMYAVDLGGLCNRCASQLAWGHQIGFARVEREPCDACRPIVAALPASTSHPAWRTVDGRARSRASWTAVGCPTGPVGNVVEANPAIPG